MLQRSALALALLTSSLAACGDGEEPCVHPDASASDAAVPEPDAPVADAGLPDVLPGPDADLTPAPAIISFTDPLVDHTADDLTGFRFTVGPADVSVTDLGFFDDGGDGLGEAHEIGIYHVITQEEIVRAPVPAGTAAALEGAFRFVPVTPTTLEANEVYVAVAYRPTAVDGVAYRVSDLQVSPAITYDADVAGNRSGGLEFVNTTFHTPNSWFGPNFKLRPGATAPVLPVHGNPDPGVVSCGDEPACATTCCVDSQIVDDVVTVDATCSADACAATVHACDGAEDCPAGSVCCHGAKDFAAIGVCTTTCNDLTACHTDLDCEDGWQCIPNLFTGLGGCFPPFP